MARRITSIILKLLPWVTFFLRLPDYKYNVCKVVLEFQSIIIKLIQYLLFWMCEKYCMVFVLI